MFHSTDILFFQRYLFTDTGEEAPHYGLVIVPSHLTDFSESILCAVMTSQPVKSTWGTYKLLETDYDEFTRDTTVRLKDLDYVPHHGLHPRGAQPRTSLTKKDAKECFKILKALLFNPNVQLGIDPFLRGAVIREWKKALQRL
jgi:hypothetical protein